MVTGWRGAARGLACALVLCGPAAAADHDWSAVGRLDFADGRGVGFCTAALVTAEVALTAAHCLIDPDTGERLALSTLAFRPGLRDGRAAAARGVRRAVLHPGFRAGPAGMIDRVAADLALIELDRPVRMEDVRPFRVLAQRPEGDRVAVVAYVDGHAEAPWHWSSCAVIDRNADVLVIDCPVEFGASGAPVLALAGGEMRIVSVVSAKGVLRDRHVALAASVEGELDALLAAFARTPADAPVSGSIAGEAD